MDPETRPAFLAHPPADQRLRGLLSAIFARLDRGRDAPGHHHDVAGIWDDGDAYGKAGAQCEWCALWNEARTALAAIIALDPAPESAGEVGWTVWDAEARMAGEGDWRGVAYSISHDILPLVPNDAPNHAYQERARRQIKAADRLCAAVEAATLARSSGS